jgi:hypothetical protein
MQLTRVTLLAVGLSALAPAAQAGSCVLVPVLSGTLKLSADYTKLGSQESGGTAATITIVTIGGATVTVSAPVIYDYPAGYNPGGDLVEVSYFGVGLLSGAVHGYTNQDTSFAAPTIITPVVLTIHNRITTASAFESTTASNPYRTRTMVTCS